MKTILFSIALKIVPAQEELLSKLFQFLKSSGYKVILIGECGTTNLLDEFYCKRPHQANSGFKKIRNLFLFYWLYYCSRFDHLKWKKRFDIWAHQYSDPKEKRRLYTNLFKSSVYTLSNISPDYFFCWNPVGCSFGPMYDLSPFFGIKRKSVESGILPRSIAFDNNGITAASELIELSIDRIRMNDQKGDIGELGFKLIEVLKNQDVNLYRQKDVNTGVRTFLDSQRDKTKILFCGCSEILNGILPYNHSDREVYLPFFSSNLDLVSNVSKSFPDACVVYKPHPAFEKKLENLTLSDNSFLLHYNPEELIKWADVVICAGTKIELSVLLLGKPLVLSGTGLLFNKGCGYEVHKKEDLKQVIQTALSQKRTAQQEDNLALYLGYLYTNFLLVPSILGGEIQTGMINSFSASFLD